MKTVELHNNKLPHLLLYLAGQISRSLQTYVLYYQLRIRFAGRDQHDAGSYTDYMQLMLDHQGCTEKSVSLPYLERQTIMLIDSYKRRFTYLRLSITDVCNFRCSYCLPDGYCQDQKPEPLTISEIATVAGAFSKLKV